MKSAIYLGVAALLAFSLPTAVAFAENHEKKENAIEISGHVDVIFGFQTDDGDAIDLGSCSFGIGGVGCNDADTLGVGRGQLGEFRKLASPDRTSANAYLSGLEIQLHKDFGENTALHAELEFGRILSGSSETGNTFNAIVEQGYITTNIPLGNGLRFLAGRFQLPIGVEDLDFINNDMISRSNIFRYARPQKGTGIDFYYQFSDMIDWHVYFVNNLHDVFSFADKTDPPAPSMGTRLGFSWGEEGRENTAGISYAGGFEQFDRNDNYTTHLFDVDWRLYFGFDGQWMWSGELIYRMDDTDGLGFAGFNDSDYLGAFTTLCYQLSDPWRICGSYEYTNDGIGGDDEFGAYTGLDQQIHTGRVGFTYRITDGMLVKGEYRADYFLYEDEQPFLGGGVVLSGNDDNSWSHGFALEFGAEF